MNASVYDLPLGHITSYLESEGWELVSDNERWYVFEGCEDIEGDPFEIVLPKNINAPDYRTYVQHTVNILSSLTDKAPQTIADNILLYDRDVLTVRLTENVDVTSSIPIHLASKQIPQFKQLIAFAASSEQNARPYFRQPLSLAKEMTKHYRFGRLLAASFGYRIESPVGNKKHFQKPHQMDLFEEDEVILPLSRRVMERIIRGLIATEKAVEQQNAQPLIDGYAEGFNANMCDAILRISDFQREPIEYGIKWSNKIIASDNMKNASNIHIRRRHFEYLETASEQLKILKPKFRTIHGLVIGLSSSGDPLSEDIIDRTVLVKWDPPGRGRPRKIRINLAKDDYVKAHRAHLAWDTISVNGIMQRKGSQWQLSEPREFRILR